VNGRDVRTPMIKTVNCLVIAVACLLFLGNVADGYSGPNCLGPYCVESNTKTQTLFERLGSPLSQNGRYTGYCFESQDDKTFLYFDARADDETVVGDLFLSDFPDCLHIKIRTTPQRISVWKTREGIGFGSSLREVEKAYGSQYSQDAVPYSEPNQLKALLRGYRPGDPKPRIGNKILSFRDSASLKSAEFCFRDGKVSCIFLSDNE
jgi:hypothetical protein